MSGFFENIANAGTELLGDGTANAIINLAADIALIFDDLVFWFKLSGIVLFLWGVWQFTQKGKPNRAAITNKAITLKVFFGATLTQFTSFMQDATQSLWVEASPSTPLGYVQAAEQARGSSLMMALMLSILAIVNFVGWIYGGVGLYRFATLDGKQDSEEAFWKATWTFVGAIMLINISLLAMDLSASLSGANTGSQISAGSGFH